MKKTLETLKAEANRNLEEFYKTTDELLQAQKQKKDAFVEQSSFYFVAHKTVKSLADYVNALKDYSSELEETFDKALKPKKQAKPVQKTEETKKTSYIK